jgi:type IV pilus assembly protein PilO
MAMQLDTGRMLEQMERLPAPGRWGVLVAVSILVLALYWFAFGSGTRQQVGVLHQQLATIQSQINEARAVAQNLETFEAKRVELEKELEAALQRLPNSKELPVLLTDISSLGKKSGLEIRGFRPEAEIDHGFYAEVPIRVEFYGSYHDVGMFFDRLSRLSRIVNVTNLEMTMADDSDLPKLKVTGVATTFRFVGPKAREANARIATAGE